MKSGGAQNRERQPAGRPSARNDKQSRERQRALELPRAIQSNAPLLCTGSFLNRYLLYFLFVACKIGFVWYF
jgi:hypothetical protein